MNEQTHTPRSGPAASIAEDARAPIQAIDSSLVVEMARRRLRANLLGEPMDPLRVGRFVLERELGSGGMGSVWRAYDDRLDRAVALKFLRDEGGDESARQRLLREARGLAQLSHPNVVPVFDAGEHERRVWIAMEHVPGRTLRAWIQEERPSASAVLAAWIDAGRGLAAVHAAGLIHRDIKPDNVMLADDGRVRVVDFGLVRAVDGLDSSWARTQTHAQTRTGSTGSLGSGSPTPTAGFVGTPAYAAPEQLEGPSVDARADQYSFCVSVWEGLCGERPSRADDQRAPGELVPLPEGARMPLRVRRALSRGLCRAPDHRFADMDALLAELAPLRRAWVGPILAALTAGALGVVVAQTQAEDLPAPPDPCVNAGAAIAQTWGPSQRATVDQQFGVEVGARVGAQLDAWARQWQATAVGTCEAHLVDRQLTTTDYEQRMACLTAGSSRVDTLVRSIERGELKSAPVLAAWLADIEAPETCATAASLGEDRTAPPALADEIQSLTQDVDHLQFGIGDPALEARLARAAQLHARALGLGWAPLIGETAMLLGNLNILASRAEPASRWYGEAMDRGLARGDLERVREAQAGLARIQLSLTFNDAAAAWRIERQAALVEALGDRPTDVARLARQRARLHQLRGDLDAAQRDYERAVALWEAAGPRYGWELATSLRLLAYLHDDRGHRDAVSPLLERARALEQLGGSPRHAADETALDEGIAASNAGDYARALPLLDKALRLATASQGPRGLLVAQAHVALSGAYDATGEVDLALDHANAADAILLATVGPEHPERAAALSAVGTAEYRAQRFAASAETFARALRIVERHFPPQSRDRGLAMLNLGDALYELGDHAGAQAVLQPALELLEPELGPAHPYIAVLLKPLGGSALGRGDYARAVSLLARALAILEANPGNLVEHAEILWLLAQAEVAAGEHAAGRSRAQAAAEAFTSLGSQWTARVTQIDAWIQQHPNPLTSGDTQDAGNPH
ncbi:protein kinase domain-containing protein [Enhygromyxa salina]|nr:tetratricopeptide repeat protein [Enhygromyxa salina]